MTDDYAFIGAVSLGKKIAQGAVTSTAATQLMLERIERLNGSLKCYETVMAEQALSDAKKADREIKAKKLRGPLHGVPIGIKDLCDIEGVPTASGIPMFRSNVAKRTSTVAVRLRAAGAVILGKLQLTEGALALHHPEIPPPVNPWRQDRWSGASSSGSGVATAAGLCYASLGSDTGGSIRFPSFANGCVGLKPTWARVSRYGVFPLAETLDHIGPITRRVEDAAAMLGAIAGRDENDPSSSSEPVPNYLAGIGKGLKNVRVGFDEKYCSADVDPAVVKTLRKAVSVLRKAGATVKAVRMPATEAAITNWVPLCAVETALAHEATYPSRKEGYGSVFAGFLESGRTLSALDYGRAAIDRRNLRGAMQRLFSDIDIMVVPIMPWLNPTVTDFNTLCESPDGLRKLIRFTCIYDTTGQPTITLPAGLDVNGSPLGFQIVGRHFEEALLCRAGMAWQNSEGGHGAVPPLAA
jgi:amidase